MNNEDIADVNDYKNTYFDDEYTGVHNDKINNPLIICMLMIIIMMITVMLIMMII